MIIEFSPQGSAGGYAFQCEVAGALRKISFLKDGSCLLILPFKAKNLRLLMLNIGYWRSATGWKFGNGLDIYRLFSHLNDYN